MFYRFLESLNFEHFLVFIAAILPDRVVEIYGFIPQQYRFLTLLYCGFLISVLLINILSFFITVTLQWYERKL